MKKLWKYAVITAAAVLAAASVAVAASSSFSDVANNHPQRDDIEHAVEQGWFQGYGDGTFKPDRAITQKQIVTVIGRAFPEGSTRADLATFLRGGSDRLAAVPDAAGGCTEATQSSPTETKCRATAGDWIVTAGPVTRTSWDQFSTPEPDQAPITASAYAEYAGSEVGNPFWNTDYTLFVKGKGYDVSTDCADDTYFDAAELLPGASTTYTICFVVDDSDLGSPALLRTTSGLFPTYEVWHKVVMPKP